MSSTTQKLNVDKLAPMAFFDLLQFVHDDVFKKDGVWLPYVWQALANIRPYLSHWFDSHEAAIEGKIEPGAYLKKGTLIFIGRGSYVEPGAFIAGPTIIGQNCIIRHGAYIRGGVITGDNVIIGHATEIKNSIMLDDSHAPHFAYIGDSILGQRVNLGAGTRLSNLPLTSHKDPLTAQRPTVKLNIEGKKYDTALAKIGAILGDDVQTGCNAVTNPGCLVGPRTRIYANTSLRKGFYPTDHVIKLKQMIEIVPWR